MMMMMMIALQYCSREILIPPMVGLNKFEPPPLPI